MRSPSEKLLSTVGRPDAYREVLISSVDSTIDADTDFTGVKVTSYPAHAVDGSRDRRATSPDNSRSSGARPSRSEKCFRAMLLRISALTPTEDAAGVG